MRRLKEKLSRKLNSNQGILKSSLTLSITYFLSNLIIVLFYVYAARKLGPDEYSNLGALLSIYFIISVSSSVVSIIIIRYISYFLAKSQQSKISRLYSYVTKGSIALGLFVFMLLFFFSKNISNLLKIGSKVPVMLLGLFLWAYIVLISFTSVLNGLQKFKSLGFSRIINSAATLVFGAFLLLINLGINGALFGLFLGALIALPYAYLSSRYISKVESHDIGKVGLLEYIIIASVSSFSIAILLNIDLILVKHFFNNVEAGYYAAVSLVASIVFFISNVFTSVMLPKASALHADGFETTDLLKDSLFYTAFICFAVTIIYFAAPDFITNLILGKSYKIQNYIGFYALAMSFLALSNVLVIYNIAVKKKLMFIFLVPAVFIEIALIALFHSSLMQIIIMLLIFNIILFIGLLFATGDDILYAIGIKRRHVPLIRKPHRLHPYRLKE